MAAIFFRNLSVLSRVSKNFTIMWKFMFMCISYICLAESSLAPFITKCKWDDSKCLKETAMKVIPLFAEGIPDLNVEKMDPMVLKHVDATKSTLKLIVTDVTVTGLKKCEVKKLTRDLAKAKIIVKLLCPANLDGKYDMDGQLFVLPIKGNGGIHVDIKKILITVDVDTEDVDKEDKKHWKIKSWKHTFDLKDKSDVKFDNLFPDNEFLRTTTNELIAKNGNDVITEIGAPIIKAVVKKVVENCKNFFTTVPLEDLILD